jgi:uncharacterized damage-inducible protein DinB
MLQPAAHAFIMALEDTTKAARRLAPADLWRRPGGAASAGFHLMHLAGSTDRLLTYARGDVLTEPQRAALAAESGESEQAVEALVDAWRGVVERALTQLASTPESSLTEVRLVGRARLPSTVLGLLFHAAEHAQRHTGQLVTTVRILCGPPPPEE